MGAGFLCISLGLPPLFSVLRELLQRLASVLTTPKSKIQTLSFLSILSPTANTGSLASVSLFSRATQLLDFMD